MTNAKSAYRNRPILSAEEIEAMLAKADKIGDEYRRLRVKALIGLLNIWKTPFRNRQTLNKRPDNLR